LHLRVPPNISAARYVYIDAAIYIGHPIYGGGQMGYGCCAEYRSFLTKEEKIGMLEEYKQNLEKEVKGIAEKIEELRKNN